MERLPSVSLVIPCRNEAGHIAKCLDSLLANDYDKGRMEIVVVDGMSDDGTRTIVEAYCRRYPNVRLISNPRKITPIAMNLGIRAASGEYVLLIGAHTEYERSYVRKLVKGAVRLDADLIGPHLEYVFPKGLVSEAISMVCGHWLGNGNARHRTAATGGGPREVETVAYGCYRRSVFDRFGYFNEYLVRAQDREFNLRISRGGGRVVFDPTIKVAYHPRTTIGAYARWTFRGAFWLFYARRFSATPMYSWRNYIPLVFALYHVVAVAVMAGVGAAAWSAMVPLALYALLVAVISPAVAVRNRRPLAIPLMAFLFALTHYAYGMGSLCGLVRALMTRRDTDAGRASDTPEPHARSQAA